ncbi:MAG: MGMT family protein [Chlamydiia bacterium]|nr:MGMT family protein [Chlamydiia bacterium]
MKLSANLPLTIKVLTGQGAIDDVTLAFSNDQNFWCELYGRDLYPDQEDIIIDWLQHYANKTPISAALLRLNFTPIPPFTANALTAVGKVPFGSTQTYSDIAQTVGSPKAMRAIGCACHHNPFPVIIPCHRIVNKQGIGGFAYPLEIKQLLLDFEN